MMGSALTETLEHHDARTTTPWGTGDTKLISSWVRKKSLLLHISEVELLASTVFSETVDEFDLLEIDWT